MTVISVGLPREILKWLQSLDLSFAITNPKRDFSNGFLVAEIMSRYFPTMISMHSFDNGSRSTAKNDNWEQLFLFCKKINLKIDRTDFEPVIQLVPGAAVEFVTKLYSNLTRRTPQTIDIPVPVDVQRTHVEKLPPVVAANDQTCPEDDETDQTEIPYGFPGNFKRSNGRNTQKQVQFEAGEFSHLEIGDVQIKPLEGRNVSALRAQKDKASILRGITASSTIGRKTSSGMDAGSPSTPQPSFNVSTKPIAELMKPIITGIIQDTTLIKSLDPRKEVAVSFIELCSDVVPETISCRVFNALTQRATTLVDTMCSLPSEFFKLWQLFAPLLNDFSETSLVFHAVLRLFRRLGNLMQEVDPIASQLLLLEVVLPTMGQLMDNAGKRDALADVTYAFSRNSSASHAAVLRGLKDIPLSLYICCLSSFMCLDTHMGMLDEHLVDLYSYYALLALQDRNPRTRVAGIAILCNMADASGHVDSLCKLVPNVQALAQDSWWEVQAQVILFASNLLLRLSDDSHSSIEKSLLDLIHSLFTIARSKNVLQVGLCSLARNLTAHPTLIPSYVTILLAQPAPLRQRLLSVKIADGEETEIRRVSYVMGGSTHHYDEFCVHLQWPRLEVATVFATEVGNLPHFEREHLEVLTACLPDEFTDVDGWLAVFDKVKAYLFVSLVDPEMHHAGAPIVKKFWHSTNQVLSRESLSASVQTLVQTWQILYGNMERSKVDNKDMFHFLKEMQNGEAHVAEMLEKTVKNFKENHPQEFAQSNLSDLFL